MRGTSMSINNLKKVYAFTSISECEDNPPTAVTGHPWSNRKLSRYSSVSAIRLF